MIGDGDDDKDNYIKHSEQGLPCNKNANLIFELWSCFLYPFLLAFIS